MPPLKVRRERAAALGDLIGSRLELREAREALARATEEARRADERADRAVQATSGFPEGLCLSALRLARRVLGPVKRRLVGRSAARTTS